MNIEKAGQLLPDNKRKKFKPICPSCRGDRKKRRNKRCESPNRTN